MKKLLVSLSLFGILNTANAFFFDPTVNVVDIHTSQVIKVSMDTYKASKPSPTIILSHTCSGVNDSYKAIDIWARKIRSWGYNVVVPDSFGPRGHSNICDRTRIVTAMARVSDTLAVIEWIKQQPWHNGKIGFIGFSHGGGVGEQISKIPDTGLSAIVEYYPQCQKQQAKVHTPVQIHIGSEDSWTKPHHCDPYKNKDNVELFVYDGATHSFDRELPERIYYGHRLVYHKQAAEQAEQRSRDFFAKNLQLLETQGK